jgi:hypothetical protein
MIYFFDLAKNLNFLGDIEMMFEELVKVTPQQLLESQFRYYIHDWLKFKRHLLSLLSMERIPHITDHYDACYTVWFTVGRSIGQEMRIRGEFCLACSYARCPNPEAMGGSRFSCGGCCHRAYCSAQCQARRVRKASSQGRY